MRLRVHIPHRREFVQRGGNGGGEGGGFGYGGRRDALQGGYPLVWGLSVSCRGTRKAAARKGYLVSLISVLMAAVVEARRGPSDSWLGRGRARQTPGVTGPGNCTLLTAL